MGRRLSTPSGLACIAVTLIGIGVLVAGDLVFDQLRLLGIILISIGSAVAGVLIGAKTPTEFGGATDGRGARPVVVLFTELASLPVAAVLILMATTLAVGGQRAFRAASSAGAPTRQILFNIGLAGRIALYVLMILPLVVLAYGLSRRAAMWRQGSAANRTDAFAGRVREAMRASIFHGRIVRKSNIYGGVMHLTIFWGFVVLLIGTIIVMIESDITVPLLGFSFYRGNFYLGYKVAMNVAGIALIAGILMAFYSRARMPKTKQTTTDDVVLLIMLLVLTLQGFALQALRLAVVGDPWASYSFGSYPFAAVLRPLPAAWLTPIHVWTWWTHFLTTFLFVGYAAYSKMIHPFTSFATVIFRRIRPRGELDPIENLETAETYGLGKLEDLNWAQLMSLDGCMHCGRCLEYCPTFNTGKPLRPRDLILQMAGYQADRGGIFSGELGQEGNNARFRWGAGPERQLIGEVVSEDEIWDCTTCGACMEQCPVYIEHVPIIVGLRRNLVLEQAQFPSELTSLFNNVEKNVNPWEYPASERGAWAKALGVKTLDEHPTAEVLYWVGCYGNFDDRNNKVARALVKCLQAANVDFAVLGKEEKCCGEPVRRVGNEYLYQMLAGENIQTLNQYHFKTVITACPHCFNTIANEYRQFGGNYRVIHHSQFVSELVNSGRLKPNHAVGGTITYHDSCYLGRYNNIYDAPRSALQAIPGVQLKEMSMNRRTSLCCGGGGGRVFMEEKRGSRINHLRVSQAAATGAEIVASACPFCLTMMEDGVGAKGLQETMKPRDIVELVAASLGEAEK